VISAIREIRSAPLKPSPIRIKQVPVTLAATGTLRRCIVTVATNAELDVADAPFAPGLPLELGQIEQTVPTISLAQLMNHPIHHADR
jgi:hypothetical protein